MKQAKSELEISQVMQTLATYISGALRKPLPEAVQEKTKHHVLDTIAAMVSGSRLLPGRKALSFIKTRGGVKEACVVASRFLTTAENAAMANGMFAHADETDDSHAPANMHPGCGIVSAALAMAEREKRSGTQLLRAVALGYDVGTRLTMSLNSREFRADGHSTHSFGPTFGCAAAAGALAGLNYEQTRYLLSYTVQQASGVSCWARDVDHIEKAFDFGGMPARNGITAAAMVKHGFTGVEDVFSGENNFYVPYGRNPNPSELIRELGSAYEIMNTNIKRWSIGSPMQSPATSLQELIDTHRIKSSDVERVVVRVSHQGAPVVDNRTMPDICMQHIIAVMLLDGKLTFESAHDTKRMKDARVLKIRQLVDLRGDDELERAMPSRQAIVEVKLKDGRSVEHYTANARGSAPNPMTRGEVDAKCFDLIAPVVGKLRARKLCDAIWDIEKIKDVRKLRPLLQAG